MTETDSRHSRIERLATELNCTLDDAVRAEILSYAAELQTVVDERAEPATVVTESAGHRSDDDHNALLWVYDEPRREQDSGPLGGLSFAIKDNIAVRGLAMTCGLTEFEYVPSFDAVVVERLLDAGASLVGKANMDAFAVGPAGQWSELGTVTNPNYEGRVPGGSSSGSGAAVAAGFVDAALGTDTGGSVRSPAACCGIVGVKPTHGLVPRTGFVDLLPSTDTIGPLTRDVDTARMTLEAIAGPDPRDPTAAHVDRTRVFETPSHITIGVVTGPMDEADTEIAKTIERVLDRTEAATDVTVTTVELAFEEINAAFSLALGAEFAWLVKQGFVTRGQGTQYNAEWAAALAAVTFNEHIASRVLTGALLDAETDGRSYVVARREAIAFRERLTRLFETVDVILTPTLRSVPPKPGEILTAAEGLQYSNTKPFSLAAGPAVSVPVGHTDGLPVSAQVVAPPFHDGVALECAKRIEGSRNDKPTN
ncbi:amidase (plasmid) [Haloferax sp. S1W]|uniref:amidase n=1 Tax=Haloferax sp. S1W TaxID=3377110 RepID=UPI0037CB5D5E